MRTAPQKRRGDPRYASDDRRGAAQKASYAAEQVAQELRHFCYLLVAVLEVAGGCDPGHLRSSHMSQLAVGRNVSRVTRRLGRADRGRRAYPAEVESIRATSSVCSLPPCGGGLGRGVMHFATSVHQSHDPHPQPLPTRGRRAHRVHGTVLRPVHRESLQLQPTWPGAIWQRNRLAPARSRKSALQPSAAGARMAKPKRWSARP
jgi:hypothetical protein